MSTTRRNVNDLRLAATRRIAYLQRHTSVSTQQIEILDMIQNDVDNLTDLARLLIPEGE